MARGRIIGRSSLVAAVLAAGLVSVAVAPVAADGNEAPGAPAGQAALTAGRFHTCVIVGAGSVKCFGDNSSGQLGLGDTVNRGDDRGEMGTSLPAVDLGTGRTATALAAGANHTCAVLDTGQVKCWGSNSRGQLGVGGAAPHGSGPGQMGDALPAVALGAGRTAVAVAAGS